MSTAVQIDSRREVLPD